MQKLKHMHADINMKQVAFHAEAPSIPVYHHNRSQLEVKFLPCHLVVHEAIARIQEADAYSILKITE